MTTKEGQKGQVLLIVIMLLATVLTVVVSIAFKGTTDTQITKLEEENQKALAAAEAGIEQLLANNVSTLVLQNEVPALSGSGITGDVSVAITSEEFASPIVQRDHQYTFYTADYSPATGLGASDTGDVDIYYDTSSASACDSLALEITQVSGSGSYTLSRTISDHDGLLGSSTGNSYSQIAAGQVVDKVTFYCRSTVTLAANSKLLIVQVLNGSTKLGLKGTGLKPQGKTIKSEARTTTGVTKKVELFQSYPQLPSEFLVTSF